MKGKFITGKFYMGWQHWGCQWNSFPVFERIFRVEPIWNRKFDFLFFYLNTRLWQPGCLFGMKNTYPMFWEINRKEDPDDLNGTFFDDQDSIKIGPISFQFRQTLRILFNIFEFVSDLQSIIEPFAVKWHHLYVVA